MLRLRHGVEQTARSTVQQALAQSEALIHAVRHCATSTLHEARLQSREAFGTVRAQAQAQVASARQAAPALLASIGAAATSAVSQARQQVDARLPSILERASTQVRDAQASVDRAMEATADCATRSVRTAAERSQALFREIAGQGPKKTLGRGFAMVRSSDGRTVTTAKGLKGGAGIEVSLRDGVVAAVVSRVRKSTNKKAPVSARNQLRTKKG